MKIVFFFGSIVFCFLLLFPYSDLSDFTSAKISEATRNQINVQFNKVGFGLLPQLGLKMSEVSLDVALGQSKLPNLQLDSIGVAPNILKSIGNSISGKAKLAGIITMIRKVQALGLFGGDLNLYLSGSKKLGPSSDAIHLEVDAQKLDLRDLTKYMKSAFQTSFSAKGFANLSSDIVLDPLFKEQPDGKYELTLQNLNIPSASYTVPMNGVSFPITLPGLKMDAVKFRGKIEDRRFIIEEGKLGDAKNDFFGEVTGDVVVNIRPGGRFDPGGYNLVVDLTLKDAMLGQLGAMAGILDGFVSKYKRPTTNGVRYNFRLKAQRFGVPPSYSNP